MSLEFWEPYKNLINQELIDKCCEHDITPSNFTYRKDDCADLFTPEDLEKIGITQSDFNIIYQTVNSTR